MLHTVLIQRQGTVSLNSHLSVWALKTCPLLANQDITTACTWTVVYSMCQVSSKWALRAVEVQNNVLVHICTAVVCWQTLRLDKRYGKNFLHQAALRNWMCLTEKKTITEIMNQQRAWCDHIAVSYGCSCLIMQRQTEVRFNVLRLSELCLSNIWMADGCNTHSYCSTTEDLKTFLHGQTALLKWTNASLPF